MNCYDIHDELFAHLVVFAPHELAAIDLADQHREAGFGFGATPFTVMPRIPPASGKPGDKLRSAMERGEAGIGHLRSDGSWEILPPGVASDKPTLPTRTEMHAYPDEDEDEYVIFAASEDRASEIFEALADNPDASPKAWQPRTWEHWQLLGLVRHQRQAQSRGVEGLGLYTPCGWCILPLDYEALGITPPDG